MCAKAPMNFEYKLIW